MSSNTDRRYAAMKEAAEAHMTMAVLRNNGIVCLAAALSILAQHGFPIVDRAAVMEAYNNLDDRAMDKALSGDLS